MEQRCPRVSASQHFARHPITPVSKRTPTNDEVNPGTTTTTTRVKEMKEDKSRAYQPEKEAEELGGRQRNKAQGMDLGQRIDTNKDSSSNVSYGSRPVSPLFHYAETDSWPDDERVEDARPSNDAGAIDKSDYSMRSGKGTFGTNAAKHESLTQKNEDACDICDINEAAATNPPSDHYSDVSGSSRERSEVASSYGTQASPQQVHPPRPARDEHAIPGAFAVSGIHGEDTTADLTIDPTVESEPSLPRSIEPISAEAVDVEADNRAFNERLQKEVDRKLAEKERNTAMAEVVNMRLCLCSPRVRRLSIAGTTLLIIAIVLAIALTLTLRPDPPPAPAPSLVDFLSSEASFDGGAAVRSPSTPQNNAMQWLENSTLFANYTDSKKIQRYTLATLYFSTSGSEWKENTGWLSDDDECDGWHSVACTDDGAITSLLLPSNGLNGTLPEELALLSDSLEAVQLNLNDLSGPIPSTISLLADLKTLWLYNNSFSGEMPLDIGLMTDLEELWLHKNELVGEIPNSIGSLTNLKWLNLESNQLSGEIPSTISLMTNLVTLELTNNKFVGKVESGIGQLTNIVNLDMAYNMLSGTIPSFIGWLKKLEELRLNGNNITGAIPTEFAWASKLERLRLSQNELAGTIPTQLGELSSLILLWLWENDIGGTIPSELGVLTNMMDLEIYKNNLTGTIPAEVFSLTKMTSLDVRSCQLTGTLSTRVGQLSKVQRFRVSRNQMVGSIPTEIVNLSNAVLIWLHLNQFTGSVPEGLCEYRPDSLRFLQADCLPIDNPAHPCPCCSACCNRQIRECAKNEA